MAWDPTQPSRVPQSYGRSDLTQRPGGPANLADILERVLDKGIVIAGDIQINLLDIELLTIKLRLLVASVDRAREMGINWWETDPSLSRAADALDQENRQLETANRQLESQNEELRERLDRLEKAIEERTNGSDGT
jgi:Gas vesicle protein